MRAAPLVFMMIAFLGSSSGSAESAGQSAQKSPRAARDVVYVTVDGKPLRLDVYLPEGVRNPALLVWVHGGAWSAGSKEQYPEVFVSKGFAIASLDFRQTTEARFPANVHDIKAAIRFLRAHAPEYGYRADRIAIGGASSGAHLAALVGVSNGNAQLEGTEGGELKQSSAVQAILSYFGASNLNTILAQSTPFGLNVREPALRRLLGGLPPGEVSELATLASPVSHVNKASPPLLLFHGDQDQQMPINQSHELEGAYQALGRDVELDVLHGAGHGGEAFFQGEALERAVKFLQRTIS